MQKCFVHAGHAFLVGAELGYHELRRRPVPGRVKRCKSNLRPDPKRKKQGCNIMET